MTSPLYSQKASIDTCCVPCTTLRKALIIKEERTYCGKQLGFARDSITVLQQVILHKDTIINYKDSTIATYVKNENNYKGIITNKDSIIKEYKKAYLAQRIQKYIAYGVSSIILLAGILY
jgi:ribonucleotide monophosphatase NagD (HAD superfamily)